MRHFFALLLCWMVFASFPGSKEVVPRPGIDWPSFRGHRASGVAEGFSTPTSWNVEESRGVHWKTPIPGLGHSSPVVWGARICVTSATGGDESEGNKMVTVESEGRERTVVRQEVADPKPLSWKVMCADKTSGKLAWIVTAHTGVPSGKRHSTSTHANATLATDGTHLVAFFGTEGLYCYRLSDGRLLWKRDLGVLDAGYYKDPTAQWGFSNSPVIHDGKVVVLADVQQGSFVGVLSIKDGKDVWRTPRSDVPTFGTPTIVEVNGRDQIVTSGWREIATYDFLTGQRIWHMNISTRSGDIPIATPVAGLGLIFTTIGHGLGGVYAIRAGAIGDISLENDASTSTYVAWSVPRDGSYVSTPLLYREHLYTFKSFGHTLNVYEAATGKRVYQQRLLSSSKGIWASPVAADGKVYLASADGDVFVLKAGSEFELLSENPLGEPCVATPAISAGRLYFRTRSHLVAIGSR